MLRTLGSVHEVVPRAVCDAVYRGVLRSSGVRAKHDTITRNVLRTVKWNVREAVHEAVFWPVFDVLREVPPHPTLQDFLQETKG